jgi:hypothetical protein
MCELSISTEISSKENVSIVKELGLAHIILHSQIRSSRAAELGTAHFYFSTYPQFDNANPLLPSAYLLLSTSENPNIWKLVPMQHLFQ